MNRNFGRIAVAGMAALLGAAVLGDPGSVAFAQAQPQKPMATKPMGAQAPMKPMAAKAMMPMKEKAMNEGMSRRMVEKVQAALNNAGAKVEVDGYIGKSTDAALKKFQADKGLPVTGKADKATLEKLGVK